MWKKPILFGVLLALGSAIAYVGAQEGTRPPSILKPQQAEPIQSAAAGGEELTRQLQQAQSAAVRDYRSRETGNALRQQVDGWSGSVSSQRTGGDIRQTGAAFVASVDESDDVEVPAILRGSTTPAQKPTPAAQPSKPSPARPLGQVDSQPIPKSAPPQAQPPAADPRVQAPATPSPTTTPADAAPPTTPSLAAPTQTSPARPQAAPRQPGGFQVNEAPLDELATPNPHVRGSQAAGQSNLNLASPQARPTSQPNNAAAATGPLPSPSDLPARQERLGQIGVDSLGAQLRVTAAGPQTIKVGKPATYEIQLKNISHVAAREATVEILLPQWVDVIDASASEGAIERPASEQERVVAWRLTDVPPSSVYGLQLQVIVTENRPFDLKTAWSIAPVEATARVQVTQPRLEMAIVGPDEVVFGETASFNISVANPGNGDAENVVIELPESLGGQRAELGVIEPGGMETFQVDLTPREKGPFVVSATATGESDLEETAEHQILVRRADLIVDLQAPQFKFAGTLAEVKLIVQNAGDAPAKGVLAAAALPEGAKYEGGVTGAEAVAGGIRWSVGDLAPGARLQYTLQCVLNNAGQNQFEAGVRDATQLQASDTAGTIVEAVAELVLEVRDPKGPRPINEAAIYELKIRNRGTKAARNVNLIAQFSAGIDPTEGIGLGHEIVDGQVIFNPIPLVDAGQEMVVRVKAVASRDGNHVFRAHLTCDNPDTHRVFEGTTRYFDASAAMNRVGEEPASSGGVPAQPASQTLPTRPSSIGPSSIKERQERADNESTEAPHQPQPNQPQPSQPQPSQPQLSQPQLSPSPSGLAPPSATAPPTKPAAASSASPSIPALTPPSSRK